MMGRHCHACGISLEEAGEGAGPFCCYCVDDQGRLKPRQTIEEGIAQWLASWQPGIDVDKARERARRYMKAMPAWADDCVPGGEKNA